MYTESGAGLRKKKSKATISDKVPVDPAGRTLDSKLYPRVLLDSSHGCWSFMLSDQWVIE